MALGTATNEHERRALLTTSRILDWQLFNPADPLPPGLVIVDSAAENQRIEHDTRRYLATDCIDAARRRLSQLGIGGVILAVREDLGTRKSVQEAALLDVLAESPEYTLIQSFDMRLPSGVTEKPLSPQERDIREQRIRQQARLDGGMAPWEPLRTNARAHGKVRRGLQLLEDETMRQPAAIPLDNAIQRAREYFLPLIAKKAQDEYGIHITGFQGRRISLDVVGSTPSGPAREDGNAIIYIVARNLAEELSPDSHGAQLNLRERLLVSFLERLFDPNTTTFQAVLSETVEDITQDSVGYSRDTDRLTEFGDDADITIQLRNTPVGEVVHEEDITAYADMHPYCNFSLAMQTPSFTVRASLESMQSQQIGRIGSDSRDDLRGRIIQSQPYTDGVPSFTPDEDVVLRLHGADFASGHVEPYIAGYRLVSCSGPRFGFMRDSTDPYAPAEVPLGEVRRYRAAELARRVGLDDFADTIETTPGITVEALRKLLETQYTEYVLPEDVAGVPNAMASLQALDDYAALVHDGLMVQQCDHASDFQRLFLDGIFGEGSASLVSGYTVGADGIITAAAHRQTVFTVPGGNMYILDSTPPFPGSTRPAGGNVQSFGSPAPLPPHLADMPTPAPIVMELPDAEELRRQHLRMTYTQLEARLQVIFRAHDPQALRERIVTLPDGDPVRRAFELVRRAVDDSATPTEFIRLQRYLDAYMAADVQLLKETGLEQYDPRITTILCESVARVASMGSDGRKRWDMYASSERVTRPSIQANIYEIERRLQAALDQLPHSELELAAEAIRQAMVSLRSSVSSSHTALAAQVIRDLETAEHTTSGALARLISGAQFIRDYQRDITT
jgi:hypothetical protein